MADIFGYQGRAPSAALASVHSILSVGGGGTEQYLVQSWNATYQQDISEVYEIGSDAMYWLKGRPIGNGTISRLVGPAGGMLFSEDAFNACNGGTTLQLSPGTGCYGTDRSVTITISGAVVVSVGTTMNAPSTGSGVQSALSEQFSFKFASMSI